MVLSQHLFENHWPSNEWSIGTRSWAAMASSMTSSDFREAMAKIIYWSLIGMAVLYGTQSGVALNVGPKRPQLLNRELIAVDSLVTESTLGFVGADDRPKSQLFGVCDPYSGLFSAKTGDKHVFDHEVWNSER